MTILLSDFFDSRWRYILDLEQRTYQRVAATSLGAQGDLIAGIAGIQRCGLNPFRKSSHFVGIFCDKTTILLYLHGQIYDLINLDFEPRVHTHRRFYLPIRQFVLLKARSIIFKCEYFYVDRFREGWPDNDDVLYRVAEIASSKGRLADVLYVWTCRQDGKPVDYSRLTDAQKRW